VFGAGSWADSNRRADRLDSAAASRRKVAAALMPESHALTSAITSFSINSNIGYSTGETPLQIPAEKKHVTVCFMSGAPSLAEGTHRRSPGLFHELDAYLHLRMATRSRAISGRI
jgi:hypothetical protein